jgi:putative membrane protein
MYYFWITTMMGHNLLPYLLSAHIIFVVTWFAGLFYMPRLFIYHTEAQNKPEPDKTILSDQFKLMSRRLWYGITWPSAVLTYTFAFWLAYYEFGFSFPGWLLLKLVFVFGLTLYHLQCGILYKRLQNNIFKWSSMKLRFWNEVATLLLFSIVFIVVLKDKGNYYWGIIGLVIFAGLLTASILIYRKKRKGR